MKRKHAQPNVESIKENPKNHQFTEKGLMLRHPFTMMVAASAGGGKTWLVKNLLENRQQWISPAPQQIIWIYGQWQPLYVEMQRIIPNDVLNLRYRPHAPNIMICTTQNKITQA